MASPASRRRSARRAPIRLAATLFSLAAALLACSESAAPATPPGPPVEGWVTIRDQRVAVEIADTPAEQSLGLGERDDLAWGRGMYFPYAQPGFYAFWMKGMRFSIDIVWIHAGRIVDLTPNLPFVRGSTGPTVRPSRPADAVLEVPAGYATAHGWQAGDSVTFERLPAPGR